MGRRGSYGRLYTYVGREYVLSFLVAFLFFFFIFFVNQILVLAQKILLKNVSVANVLLLVIFSIPQFLMYTMPFGSLASASMVIGNLSSQNEILALRSCGVHVKEIFRPIIFLSILLSIATLFIADRMIPYATEHYKELYARMLQSVPTLELDSYSSTKFGKRVISNGAVEGNTLYDVVIFDYSDLSSSRVISASKGTITVLDIDRFLYRLDLEDPRIMITDEYQVESYSLASASSMSLYLSLASTADAYVNVTPSQMSLSQLREAISQRQEEQDDLVRSNQNSVSSFSQKAAVELYNIEKGTSTAFTNAMSNVSSALNARKYGGYSFYYQYYRSEFQKKIALSLACTFLVFVAFPISFFRVRNGRLLGFGISMFVAVAYWFFLYYMHIQAVTSPLNPALFLWAPNAVVVLAGVFLLWRTRK